MPFIRVGFEVIILVPFNISSDNINKKFDSNCVGENEGHVVNGKDVITKSPHTVIKIKEPQDIVTENRFRYLITDDASDFETEVSNNVEANTNEALHSIQIYTDKIRPATVVNKHPEKDKMQYKSCKTVPGNSHFNDIPRNGKKIY